MKIKLDKQQCKPCGFCTKDAPHIFGKDDEGYPVFKIANENDTASLPLAFEIEALKAEHGCYRRALTCSEIVPKKAVQNQSIHVETLMHN
jgi:ferredoxin